MDRIKTLSPRRLLAFLGAACASTLLMLGAQPAFAAEFLVNTLQDTNSAGCTAQLCSLREALLAANASGEPSIVRLGAGAYTISISGYEEDDGFLGDFDIDGNVTVIGAGIDQTRIGTTQLGEQIVDVAAGAQVRFENLSMGVGVRSGRFGSGNAAATSLSFSGTRLGVGTAPGDTINAFGNLSISDSILSGGRFSSGQAVIRFEGSRLAISGSQLLPGSVGVEARMTNDGVTTFVDSAISDGGLPSRSCNSLNIMGGARIELIRSQSIGGLAAQAPTCLSAAAVTVKDSAFSTDPFRNQALSVHSAASTVSNSTIVGSIRNSGNLQLAHVTLGSQVTYAGQAPLSIDNFSGAVSVSNSALIGGCAGNWPTVLGNNIEALGNTCGLPLSTNRVNITYMELQLSELDYHGGPTLNFLPSYYSKLRAAFSPEGHAQCLPVDQRGFLRTAKCSIGAIEVDAGPRDVMLRSGFDSVTID